MRGTAPRAVESDPPALDPRVLASLGQLDPHHAKHLMARVLLTYRDSQARQLGQIRRALDQNDLAALRLSVHTLKSASASVGAGVLSQLCAALESGARTGEGALPGLLARLTREAARVEAAVQQMLSDLPPASP